LSEISHHTVWDSCIESIKKLVGEQSFKTWFEPIQPVSLINFELTIAVPSQYFYEYLEEQYIDVLRRVIHEQLGPFGKLKYQVLMDKGNEYRTPYTLTIKSVKAPVSNNSHNNNSESFNPFSNGLDERSYFDNQLNSHYSFESYIEGDCNRLARSAGQAVADKPGVTSFNPLMVYGVSGLGKTHLVQAIGNHIVQNQSEVKVLYVTSDKFANQFIEATRNANIQNFANFYSQVDVLIIDDVQFFAGKPKTEEIFFQIFNHLHQNKKQIILTSDCAPKDLGGMQERLLSRFKWGLSADLQAPDFETKVAIIKNKMEADGIEIPDNVIEYLAYSVEKNVRELEGVLISMIAQASLNRREIDLELAKQTLQSLIQNIETEVDVDYIQKCVAEYFCTTVADIKDKTRKKEIVLARQVAMYFAKELTNLSLKTIGYHFGNRDHSTVIHAIQMINDLIVSDRKVKMAVDDLKKKLKINNN
jgi:chromosomal replication initiator protein